MLDDMGPAEQVYETNAVNQTKMPGRSPERMDDFTIDVEEPNGPEKPKVFYVNGKALEKFAQVWEIIILVDGSERGNRVLGAGYIVE